MSNLPAETAEPDPATTSPDNEQTVNKTTGETDDIPAPVEADGQETNRAATEGTNGESSEGKNEERSEERSEEKIATPDKTPEKKPRTYENGVLKTSAQESPERKRNSKYDPSVLPTTNDPKEIRAQVYTHKSHPRFEILITSTKGRVLFWRCKFAD